MVPASRLVGVIVLLMGVMLTGVGLFTSNTIDNWYDEAEFEDLIRDGLKDQQHR